jgi:ABC-type multidrug transport system fused ATPase/permease subunit
MLPNKVYIPDSFFDSGEKGINLSGGQKQRVSRVLFILNVP